MNYHKLKSPVQHTLIIEKSKFITDLLPISSQEEAKSLWLGIKQLHPKANHHCYAYILSSSDSLLIMNQSDDGEPSKTAGLPMLEQLKHANLMDTLAVVTRYFGGTLLGTGGLIRAYAQSVRAAIIEADLIETQFLQGYEITVDYQQARHVEYILNQQHAIIKETRYEDKISLIFYTPDPKIIDTLKQLDPTNIDIRNKPAKWV